MAGLQVRTYQMRNFTGLNNQTLDANRSWIRYWSNKNALFVDIGLEPGSLSRGAFYALEDSSLTRWSYGRRIQVTPGF